MRQNGFLLISQHLRRSSTMSLAFATEKQLAVAAVRRACALTSSVFNKLVKNETLTKGDKSPVTGTLFVLSQRSDLVSTFE